MPKPPKFTGYTVFECVHGFETADNHAGIKAWEQAHANQRDEQKNKQRPIVEQIHF